MLETRWIDLKDYEHPFFRPLWRRVAVVVVCVAWSIFEFATGAPFWGTIALGFAGYADLAVLLPLQAGRSSLRAAAGDQGVGCMSKLLVKKKAGNGRVAHVTPENAGWTYVGFDLHRLKPGDTVSEKTGGTRGLPGARHRQGEDFAPAARISACSASA